MPTMIPNRHLFGPGPSNPYPEATAALGYPLLGHLDPDFITRLDNTCEGLRRVWGTTNSRTLPLSGTGSLGMETAFVNTLSKGDVAVIAVNGLFGQRMCEVASRCGAEVVRVDHDFGQPIDVERVAAAHPNPTVIAAVHAETSTGVLSDIKALGSVKGDALLIADAVTSIGGSELRADDWGIDVGYAGTQKCLGVAPGLAPFTISDAAFSRRVETPQSWYMDLGLLGGYVGGNSGGGRTYHHTAPVAMVASLEAALDRITAEGIENAWARHEAAGRKLQTGLQDMGLDLFAAEGHRLPQLTTVKVPDGVDSAAARAFLLTNFDIEIGGGVGEYADTVWRIGLMGPNANDASVALLLGAIEEAIKNA
ncbi:pyridoxal-phosphate-dependent aminotransferase family protein [Spelaeicoccus albus]|uniref:Alanine-glyoxylate transaminase/serine-glyoxylate transaminase/serine-pyruvate transaminase n=1 Tax=Spelaeicoccus albus TaxID=1280376 RepID=A0A7Z0D385_9MICO|nr:alanine--glyoxylate aminotransferase family protein [Spelaeicoccus albus]NYI68057.1 alanine-glyoxylate transaminase/serine-glyoxylate transaminase/serine-pyruvate transaminase [Spelaeicoccus albus]